MEPSGDPVAVFLHMPKAGGATFTSALRRVYPKVVTRDGPDPSVAVDAPADASVIAGHLAYGVHHYLDRPAVYLTLLREPVERAISAYRYIKRSPNHPLHRRVHDEPISLGAYVRVGHEPLNVDNGQVRLLSGNPEVAFRTCDEAMLDTAKEHLASFAAVGLTERFDESLVMCKLLLGWGAQPRYRSANVSPDALSIDNVPKATLARLCEQNRLDIELYRYACELFAAQRDRLGPSFGRHLAAFRSIQWAYTTARDALGDSPVRRAITRVRSRGR